MPGSLCAGLGTNRLPEIKPGFSKLLATGAPSSLKMRLTTVVAVAILSRLCKASCLVPLNASEPRNIVTFKFSSDMLINFNHYTESWSTQMLQILTPSRITICDFYKLHCRHTVRLAPEVAEIFGRVFAPKAQDLCSDLPKYLCQPFLEGDGLRLVIDMFSDRLDQVLDEIRTNVELSKVSAPVASLVRIALFMALPPFDHGRRPFGWYHTQELLPIIHGVECYRQGRKKWREALEKAQKSGLSYEGPVPEDVRGPMAEVSQFWQENWDRLPGDIWLYVLCMTGPYIWYARLVCTRWHLLTKPRAMAGVLGYGGAFKILSGRMTFKELSLRLDSLARMGLDELNRMDTTSSNDTVGSSSGRSIAASTGRWGSIVNGLKEIIRVADPIYVLHWYRDSLVKILGLSKLIEADVFALFLNTRDDVLASVLLSQVVSHRSISDQDPGWNNGNRCIGYRLIRAYLEKYPEATHWHPLPREDSWEIWLHFQGL